MIIMAILAVSLVLTSSAWSQFNADFVGNPLNGNAPLPVTFTDQSTGMINTWVWTFTGGSPSSANGQGPHNVTYNTPGTYTVSLYIKGGGTTVITDTETKTAYITVYEGQEYDFGDAPDPPYPTLVANNGARHIIVEGFHLGSLVDGDPDGQESSDARGDDTDGMGDEDGVTFLTPLKPMYSADVDVTASGLGLLNAWIDFNADDDWDDAGEQIFINYALSAGLNPLSFPVPEGSAPGLTFARFRFSTDQNLTVRGQATDGEVEDYQVEIEEADSLDFGDAPDDVTHNYFTLLPQGAYHPISREIYLGTRPDGEPDGQPQPDLLALGDDTNGQDDEDGVTMPAQFVAGGTSEITVHTVGHGKLRVWFDFDGDGFWDDPLNPTIVAFLGPGIHPFTVNVPAAAALGDTYARFRYSTDRLLYAKGPGSFGEVEDYLITIVSGDSLDFGDAPDSYSTTLPNGARHPVSRQIYLGPLMPDDEDDGQPSSGADGDDSNMSDDEDGVTPMTPIIPGQIATFHVTMQGVGVLRVWIDWNADGNWVGDPGEYVYDYFNGIPVPAIDIDVNVPPDAVLGDTYARFRYSFGLTRENAYSVVSPGGLGDPGEVEDYLFTIEGGDTLDFGDAPDSYSTTLPNGARHPISDGIYLGGKPDGEDDGQPDAISEGDDGNGLDDEDGFTFPNFIPGQIAKMKVGTHLTTLGLAYLHGWIDFTGDGDWDDTGEHVFAGLNLNDGIHILDVNVPSDAVVGDTHARFRYSYDQGIDYFGLGDEGEVEDHLVSIVLDFGDAPDSYSTTLLQNGARHQISDDLYLGSKIDGEIDGQPNGATGDDLNLMDDEDGLIAIPVLVPGMPTFITVVAHSTMGEQMFHAWIDFNGDGIWGGGEKIYENYPMDDGIHSLVVNVPATAITGLTYARFRYSPTLNLNFFGEGDIGEVEDYQVLIDARELDFGDAPDDGATPRYPTLLVNNGAAHPIDPAVYLGTLIDPETDGQPNGDADGDDIADMDDGDGVEFNSSLIPGGTANITVTASVDGGLFGYADFNGDGDWGDGGELIFSGPISSGPNALSFGVPIWATGRIYMRFRFVMHEEGMIVVASPSGIMTFGEVEDYVVEIESGGDPGIGAIKWYQPPLKSPKSYYHNSFWGWDENSVYTMPIMADDWFCADPRPVTGIQWWGSYADWDSVTPPPNAPNRFHIAIWTNDTLEIAPRGIGHPEKLVWEQIVSRGAVSETWVGSDFHHEFMDEPDSCFNYLFVIPEPDWFHQEFDSTYYWLTIAARYEDDIPEEYIWGWTTRERYFRNDGLRILSPTEPGIDSLYHSGEVVKPGWDMSFILYTTIYGTPFDYGDAMDPEYPTEFESNGGHHMIWPDLYLGGGVDSEPDGKSDTEALWDDTDGSDDEDGVTFTSELVVGGFGMVTVNAFHPGLITAWIDYNANGSWNDPGEHILIDMPIVAGNNNLAFNIPFKANVGTTSARFRFCMVPGIPPEGLTIGGEIEDYEVTISAPTAVEDQEILDRMPREFELMQNYPNPFNPETTIKFSLPRVSEVLLTIFDVYGREVRTLLHGEWSPGSHGVVWDGRDRNGQIVSTGMYFYRIDVRPLLGEKKKYVDVKKMIFMK